MSNRDKIIIGVCITIAVVVYLVSQKKKKEKAELERLFKEMDEKDQLTRENTNDEQINKIAYVGNDQLEVTINGETAQFTIDESLKAIYTPKIQLIEPKYPKKGEDED